MHHIYTFGERLGMLMKSHKLTASALAARLKLRNAVTVSRLLRDETSEERRTEVLRMLRARPEIFSQAECGMLGEALEVSRLGKSAYLAQRGIHDLIFHAPCERGRAPSHCRYANPNGARASPISSLFFQGRPFCAQLPVRRLQGFGRDGFQPLQE